MALDSIFLRAITLELNTRLTGARVEKAMQPERDSIILALHTNTGSAKLIASASPSSARIQLTDMQLKNPDSRPMFCRLLRTPLVGGRIRGVIQQGFDRVI